MPAGADGPPSSLDGVPFGQPALALAAQLQRRAARAGVPDSLADLPGEDVGAELFRLVAKARAAGLEPELELRAAARRYGDHVRAWERSLAEQERSNQVKFLQSQSSGPVVTLKTWRILCHLISVHDLQVIIPTSN